MRVEVYVEGDNTDFDISEGIETSVTLLSSVRLTMFGTLGAEFGDVTIHSRAHNLSVIVVLFYLGQTRLKTIREL